MALVLFHNHESTNAGVRVLAIFDGHRLVVSSIAVSISLTFGLGPKDLENL
jgi:hypothetical protein